MSSGDSFARGLLGRTGIPVFRLGLPTSYRITTETFEKAFERGINCFYWGWMRDAGALRDNFVNALRKHPEIRDRLVIAACCQLDSPTSFRADRLLAESLACRPIRDMGSRD